MILPSTFLIETFNYFTYYFEILSEKSIINFLLGICAGNHLPKSILLFLISKSNPAYLVSHITSLLKFNNVPVIFAAK